LEILDKVQSVVIVALGLGFVIFIHELGHFLLAKWNGVKVLKFSIGFGPALLKWRRGETTYALSALPLGGFVKMLGEGMDEEENKTDDPRAYSNRPVGARMAIISAGVIMNLLFGLACFTGIFLVGTYETPATIGYVVAGSPAYKAGIRPGDEIVAIDGRRGVSYMDLMRAVTFSTPDQVVKFTVLRPGREAPMELGLQPRRWGDREAPGIGVGPAADVALASRPFLPMAGTDGKLEVHRKGGLPEGGKVVAIGPAGGTPEPVATPEDINRLLARHRDRPIEIVVESPASKPGASPERTTATVPVNHFVDVGLRLEAGPIAGVQDDSPAYHAGFREGDRIVKVDGRADFDPMRLPDEVHEHAGRPMTFEVVRSGPGGSTRTLTLTATPDDRPPWTEPVQSREPLDVPGLGLAFPLGPKVTGVREGSPAQKAKLKPGDTLRAIALVPPGDKPEKPVPQSTWLLAFAQMQEVPKVKMLLTLGDSESPVELIPAPEPTWFNPIRGLQFQAKRRELPPQGLASALRRGSLETLDNIVAIYATIRGLIQGRLSKNAVGGPIKIADVAYGAARLGLPAFIPFLAMLSINLAVINFLPIPPLDGGQMLFLIAEKVRGRPLPENAHFIGMVAGLVFVLVLILFVSVNDVWSYFRTPG
jgi:regulator of sigma E protease